MAARLRKINLIEVLREEAALSRSLEQLGEYDDEELLAWSEADIRAFFAYGGWRQPDAAADQPAGPAPPPPQPIAANGIRNAVAAPPLLVADAAPPLASPPLPRPPRHSWPWPPEAELRRWFPATCPHALKRRVAPAAVVLAFPNSGSCEDMYSSEGTGARRAPSPLLGWCRDRGAVLMAVQPPGRALRTAEPPARDLPALAAALLPAAAAALLAAPRYFVIGHSVGAWAAYEFLRLARAEGLPMPAAAFLSAMPAPDIPEGERPWRRQAALGPHEFQDECRAWGITEVALDPAVWPAFEPLLRADFRLFDEYRHAAAAPSPHAARQEHATGPAGAAGPATGPAAGAVATVPFGCPITAFWGALDIRVTEALVMGWARFTTGRFELVRLPGACHLWPINDRAAKREWLECVVRGMEAELGLGACGCSDCGVRG